MTRNRPARHYLLPALIVAASAGFLAGCATSRPSGNANVPDPAKPVDLARYLGRWYEIGRYEASFEAGCEGVTADYSMRDDGLIRVVNTCREGSPNGKLRAAEAKAKIVPDSNNAKLKVSFFGPFYVGDYWVLDHGDDYEWSIVGEGSGKYLWLLSRAPVLDREKQNALVDRARQLGYDTSRIRYTQQPPG
jgi:apolipoprotein D and lipocalin family protein